MTLSLVDPGEAVERQNAKLRKIVSVLMARVEQATDESGAAFAQFQRALTLEEEVRGRTRDLERTLDLLNQSNARLSLAMTEAEAARADLTDAIEAVREGFALFGSDDRLVLSNSRFCEALPDLRPHLVPGLRFVDYIRRVAASPHLALPEGRRRAGWMRERLRHHRLPSATFNVQTTAETAPTAGSRSASSARRAGERRSSRPTSPSSSTSSGRSATSSSTSRRS